MKLISKVLSSSTNTNIAHFISGSRTREKEYQKTQQVWSCWDWQRRCAGLALQGLGLSYNELNNYTTSGCVIVVNAYRVILFSQSHTWDVEETSDQLWCKAFHRKWNVLEAWGLWELQYSCCGNCKAALRTVIILRFRPFLLLLLTYILLLTHPPPLSLLLFFFSGLFGLASISLF